jgi:hypothetical protein
MPVIIAADKAYNIAVKNNCEPLRAKCISEVSASAPAAD